jgi:hypothetical protein
MAPGERVRLGSYSIGDAGAVRALLEAHGIAATAVGGGPYASLSVDVWVDRDDAERAAELVTELQQTPLASDDEDLDEPSAGDSLQLRLQRRRQIGVAVLLSLCLTFGTAHMFARAWLRGFVLAATEAAAIVLLAGGSQTGVALLVAAILLDLVGSVALIRKRLVSPRLPIAQARR